MMKLDIVVPFYNEQGCVLKFVQQLIKALERISGLSLSFYFVNDGSDDQTPAILNTLSRKDSRISVIHLLRNYGHQRALITGLDQCRGDAVLMMDGDGQHPVDVAVQMVLKTMDHPSIFVIQGIRKESKGSFLKKSTSFLFYWTMNHLLSKARIDKGASDFRIMRREAIDIIIQYPDRHRNLRVLLSLLSLPTLKILYSPSVRLGGVSKYNWRKMIQLSMDGIFAYSALPLRMSLILMVVSGIFGLTYMFYGLIVFFKDAVVPGWTSIIVLISLLFSAIFAVMAIMAEYIKRIYEDVRGHPICHFSIFKRDIK